MGDRHPGRSGGAARRRPVVAARTPWGRAAAAGARPRCAAVRTRRRHAPVYRPTGAGMAARGARAALVRARAAARAVIARARARRSRRGGHPAGTAPDHPRHPRARAAAAGRDARPARAAHSAAAGSRIPSAGTVEWFRDRRVVRGDRRGDDRARSRAGAHHTVLAARASGAVARNAVHAGRTAVGAGGGVADRLAAAARHASARRVRDGAVRA